jgi:hypothetical protein
MSEIEEDLNKAESQSCPRCLSKLMRKYQRPARHFLLHSPGLEEEEFSEVERSDAMKIVAALAENPSLPESEYLFAAVLAPEHLARNPAATARIGHEETREDPDVATWADKLAEELAHRVLQKQVLFSCEQAARTRSKLAAARGRREMVPAWLCTWKDPAVGEYVLSGQLPSHRPQAAMDRALRPFRKALTGTFDRADAHEMIDALFEGLRGWPFARAVSLVLLDLERRFGTPVPSAWPDLIVAGTSGGGGGLSD